jgi:hypothetical protein
VRERQKEGDREVRERERQRERETEREETKEWAVYFEDFGQRQGRCANQIIVICHIVIPHSEEQMSVPRQSFQVIGRESDCDEKRRQAREHNRLESDGIVPHRVQVMSNHFGAELLATKNLR